MSELGFGWGSPQPVVLAERVMKARKTSCCARCGSPVLVGERIGLIPDVGWCHVVPCIVLPVRTAQERL